MESSYIDRFIQNKKKIRAGFKAVPPQDYQALIEQVLKQITINEEEEPSYREMDWRKIHLIDDGDYQGTLLFIIPENSCQPDEYWYVKVSYGSCSGCDTLEAVKDESDETTQLNDYMTLALHIVQNIKKMD